MKKFLLVMAAMVLVVGMASIASGAAAETVAPPAFFKPGSGAYSAIAHGSPQPGAWQSWGYLEILTAWVMRDDYNNGSVGTGRSAFQTKMEDTSISASRLNADGTVKSQYLDNNLTYKRIDERARIYLQYGDPKTVRAVIAFEMDSTDWGEKASPVPDANRNHMGSYTTDQVALEVKWAFLDFPIPNTPIMVTAGLQGFYIGGRMLMSDDAPGVKVILNLAPHKLTGMWWRENDGTGVTADYNSYHVNDTYALQYDLAQQIFNIYAYGLYKNDLYSGSIDRTDTSVYSWTPTAATAYDDHPYWLGVGGGLRPGNWDFTGQFIYNGGTRDFKNNSDVTFKTWAAEAMAQYQIGPGLTAAVEGEYSTGNDADKTDTISLYNQPWVSEARTGFGNDRSVYFFMNGNDVTYIGNKQTDMGGMWYARANGKYSPLSWLLFNANFMYIGDTSSGTPGTVTDPVTGTVVRKVINSPVGARVDKDCSYVGSELNLITTFRITNSFIYNLGLGVFFPGDVYDQPNKNAERAYAVNSKLVFTY